jgi:hypothetical protein
MTMNDRSEIDIAEFLADDWLPWELAISGKASCDEGLWGGNDVNHRGSRYRCQLAMVKS